MTRSGRRSAPPRRRPAPPVAREARLSNGLRLIHLHTQSDPISAAHLFLPGGAGLERSAEAGLSTLLWSLLLKGTERRTARQLAEDIEGIGASIGGGATHDYSEISCHAVSDYFLPALEILSEALLRPAFPATEIEKERGALIAAIKARRENIFAVASEELNKRLYGSHPYGRLAAGREDSVAALTEPDLRRWHRRIVTPERGILTVASNIPFDRLKPEVERLFGRAVWRPGARPVPPLDRPLVPKHPVRAVRDERFEQAYLLMGFAAPAVDSRDYIPLKLLGSYLGGGMSAVLFQELREKQGLAYDVGAFYASKKSGSAFVIYMGLQMARLAEARGRIDAVLAGVRTRAISTRALNEIKSYIKGTYILDHQTNSQRAHYLGWWTALGLGSIFDRSYLRAIDRVTPAAVLRAAKLVLARPPVVVEIHPKGKTGAPSADPDSADSPLAGGPSAGGAAA